MMPKSSDKFIKLTYRKRPIKTEVELSHELSQLKKEEIQRIKIKAQHQLNKHS